ncbi:MAG: AAA family ATPase [Aquirufa antheringensis]|nr:AAA family ATPase [Aquirufa antheringensis]
MFKRIIIIELEKWRRAELRKPLIIRGARQVGKTTLVNQFSKQFNQYIYLNLELDKDKAPFEQFSSIENLVNTLFFLKNLSLANKHNTLLFIDEIQEVPKALTLLRYFQEEFPEIAVIAAGSMLESLFDKNLSYPVGRVDYLVIRPVSFPEFLEAMGETSALEQLKQIPLASFAHSKLLELYHTYALIGGMPEIVQHYVKNKDLVALGPIYDALITGYLDDVEKYSANNSQMQHIRHCIKSSFSEAGRRIKFEGFGNSAYKSREMGESLRTLEKALLVQLIYPNTSTSLPMLPDLKKSPRLQILDSGLLNYFVGIQKDIIGTRDLNSIYQGTLIEHLTGQELLASQFKALSSLHFWVREKKESNAEVDFIYLLDGQIYPIEVKSGKEGKLKSLHLFMDQTTHDIAIRLYAGELRISESITTSGKKYQLLNLPYFLASQMEPYIMWFKSNQNKE